MASSLWRRAAAITVVAVCASCRRAPVGGEGPERRCPGPDTEVRPAAAAPLAAGDTLRFGAFACGRLVGAADWRLVPVAATFAVADTAVAAVNGAGLLTARRPGATWLVVRYAAGQPVRDEVRIVVVP